MDNAYAPYSCTYIFTMAYGMSYGPIGWILPSEVFPTSVRSKGVALSTSSNWINNCTYLYFFYLQLVLTLSQMLKLQSVWWHLHSWNSRLRKTLSVGPSRESPSLIRILYQCDFYYLCYRLLHWLLLVNILSPRNRERLARRDWRSLRIIRWSARCRV